jgi:RNA methyltransferase, TrmH family
VQTVFATRKHEITEITSSSNSTFREWRLLLGGKGIKKSSKAVVSGEKVVLDTIKNKPGIVINCIIPTKGEFDVFDVPDLAIVYRLDTELFAELDIFGTKKPLLIVKTEPYLQYDAENFEGEILLMTPFQDPVNIGSVIRTASAFGVRDVMLMEEASSPYNPKSIRASAGEVFNMRFYRGQSVRDAGRIGLPVVALSRDGIDMAEFRFPQKFALLAGVEGPGLPENLVPDYKISIPIEANVESLNASVAVSITLYECRRRGNLQIKQN